VPALRLLVRVRELDVVRRIAAHTRIVARAG
jgi:hypothetical protein